MKFRKNLSKCIIIISIYTLSDLGDLSNLIGSLSQTIQQYSPPSKWIMCELGVFPIFLENNLLKLDNPMVVQRTTQQTFLAINLASQQKTTKLYFSSQVRKQFKVLTVPFKPLCCC